MNQLYRQAALPTQHISSTNVPISYNITGINQQTQVEPLHQQKLIYEFSLYNDNTDEHHQPT